MKIQTDTTVYELLASEVIKLGRQALHLAPAEAKLAIEAQLMIVKEFPEITAFSLTSSEDDKTVAYKDKVTYLDGMLERRKAQAQSSNPAKKEQTLTVNLDVDTTEFDAKLDRLSARVKEIAQEAEQLEKRASTCSR